MNSPTQSRPPVRPLLLLVVLTLAGWMTMALWPIILRKIGFGETRMWYLDSYAILAAIDARGAGMDPHLANPLDVFWRNHVYSDWWYALGWLGVTREDNFVVGSAWVGAFALTAWLGLRPRNFGEAWMLAAVLLSPPFLLAVFRGNNDLVIFVLLTLCGLAAAGTTWVRQILAVAALALVIGLKYYPVPAALAFIWVRPLRRMPLVMLGATAVAAAALASIWSQIPRGQFYVESGLFTFGAPLLWRDLGWSDPASLPSAVLLLTVAAVILALGKFTVGLASQGNPRERMLAALSAIVVLACFATGVSFGYRWIFSFWMAVWLWRRSTNPTGTPREIRTARVGCGLLLLCLWLDGLFCLYVNTQLLNLGKAKLLAMDLPWRLCTQPLHWLLMMLFAGWLLEAVVSTVKEWHASSSAAAA